MRQKVEEGAVRTLVTLFVALAWTLLMPWLGLILLVAYFRRED